MARPKKTRKLNHGGNSTTTMEDLDDHMLTQILFRLPSGATVRACCSLVNKRWCSLISDPNFPDQFVDHKKKTTALLKASGSDHEDDEPPWSFITTMRNSKKRSIITKFIFASPKLSLEFLPCHTLIATATFKDLVLWFDYLTRPTTGRDYYITNPLTKQWVALPPTPWVNYRSMSETRTVLICQPPYNNHTKHNKFRVVELRYPCMDHSLRFVDLAVYCSEIGEWKEIKLRVPNNEDGPPRPEIVVCNGIIYFTSGLSLRAFNPFDVNGVCGTRTLTVRVMPPLPDFGCLQESCGQLLVLHTPKSSGIPYLTYEAYGATIEMEMVVSRLDLNKAPLVWETTFQGLCKGNVSIDSSYWPSLEDSSIEDEDTRDIGIHPYNDKLIYMRLYLYDEQQLVLCDTRTGYITPLKSLPKYYAWRLLRLEHQWWPTSVPALVQQ